ncbi:hypothetical protein GGR08_001009 [Bartonella fuyuanensis]|uniref:Uncharacterized protein n=1 Tax=Bartonella fuyuanensis TaxID=1460968 RepID=A0A840DYF3_9HYPH|nr:hypothetical protein [Bartonella fuyuanensis]
MVLMNRLNAKSVATLEGKYNDGIGLLSSQT